MTSGGKAGSLLRFATSFVGREALLGAVRSSLAEHRVVTLLGPPGVGKSRLAAEVAARGPERFLWCAIEGVSSVGDVAERLAREPFDRLVFDGAERAEPGFARLLRELTELAPTVSILVTSRRRIEAAGEALIEVPPLDLSPLGEAEELFLARASIERHDFAPTDAERAELQTLVRSLDGLPLAIELAAARSRFVKLGSLADRLSGLAARPEDLPLWTAVEGSIGELPVEWRRAFLALGVFRGGFGVEAAEEVVGAPGVDVLSVLGALADRSLIGRRAGPSGRFAMLGTVRAVAERRIDPATWAAVRARHAVHFATLAERCMSEDAIDPAEQARSLAGELENLAFALEWARAERAPVQLILAIAWAVACQATGAPSAAFSVLEALIDATPDATIVARARAGAVLAGIAREIDRCAAVLGRLIAVVTDARAAGHPGALAVAVSALGEVLTALGRFDEGARCLLEAREIERNLGRPGREARVLHALGVNRVESGRLGEARLTLREALAVPRPRAGAQEARTLIVLGVIEIEEGGLERADEHLGRALSIAEEIGDRALIALATTNRAAMLHESGDLDAAAAEYARAIVLMQAAGMRRGEALARAYAGHCYFERGELAAARAAYEEALARLATDGWRHTMVLAPYAAVAAMLGDVELGSRTLDEAEVSLRRMGQERLALAVEVWRGFLDLAAADHAQARGDGAGAAIHVQAARRRALATLVEPAPRASGGPALAQQSTDMRVALRALRRAVNERGSPEPSARGWEVTPDGGVVQCPSGDRIDLRRRAALRRVVARFAVERMTHAGRALSVEELVQAGWPHEKKGKVTAKAGRDRVYAAVAMLRKLGLDTLLQSTGDGYRFDPDVPLRLIAMGGGDAPTRDAPYARARRST